MAVMTIFLLYLTTFGVRINGEAAGRGGNVNFSDNPAAVFRYANFPSIVGRQLHARQEGCGCQEGEKCCTTDEKATFCVPESATCCSRTWCNGELETCCRDGPNGGCCPKDTMCATGGKGCCKKDRPCFGPFMCYDNSSKECKPSNITVEAFQCCPGTAPWCLFDPENGYGCFVEKTLPTYSKEVLSTPTDVVKAPTDVPTSGSATNLVSSTGTNHVGASITGSRVSTVGGDSLSASAVKESGKPSNSGSGTATTKTATTKRNSTEAPISTDSASEAVPAIGGSMYVFLTQAGAAALALIMLG